MINKTKVPEFGNLSGIKVVNSSTSFAGPIAAGLMAEWGADVIWLENQSGMDIVRYTNSGQQEHRNQRSICMDIKSSEGREALLKLLKDTDILIESSKGGTWEKMGLTDEVLWSANPALVICHISGYGQTGLDKYVKRPSYDGVIQAFGCYIHMNGFADRPGVPAYPATADMLSALMTLGSSLAALNKAKETGVGDSIDMAQFEVLTRMDANFNAEWQNFGSLKNREGNRSDRFAGFGLYGCKDGIDIYTQIFNAGVVRPALKLLGLANQEGFDKPVAFYELGTPEGDIFEKAIVDFCISHPAEEVEDMFNENNIPCSRVMDFSMVENHPQYEARNVFTEWEKIDGEKHKGVNVIPKFKNRPGQIWRGMPIQGMDNSDVLDDLGYSEEEINQLYENKVLAKKDK